MMITTILFSSMMAAQVQGPLPQNAAIVYSGIPGLIGAKSADVKLVSNSVTGTLTKDTVTFNTVTLFRNNSKKPVALILKLPVDAQNPALGRGYDIDFQALWDKTPLKINPYKEEQAVTDPNVKLRNGLTWAKFISYKSAAVTFKPLESHALRLTFTVPIGKSGLDGLQRIVAYDLASANQWAAPVDQINFSLKYDTDIVFQTIASEPKFGWQVGPKGAWFQLTAFTGWSDSLARFMFYPGGFDRIGATP